MVGLQDAILVRPELLKLGLEKLRLLVRNGLLVEDEDVGNVVGVDLDSQYDVTRPRVTDVLCSSNRSRSDPAPS